MFRPSKVATGNHDAPRQRILSRPIRCRVVVVFGRRFGSSAGWLRGRGVNGRGVGRTDTRRVHVTFLRYAARRVRRDPFAVDSQDLLVDVVAEVRLLVYSTFRKFDD